MMWLSMSIRSKRTGGADGILRLKPGFLAGGGGGCAVELLPCIAAGAEPCLTVSDYTRKPTILVELMGFEPTTYAMRTRRSTN